MKQSKMLTVVDAIWHMGIPCTISSTFDRFKELHKFDCFSIPPFPLTCFRSPSHLFFDYCKSLFIGRPVSSFALCQSLLS